MGSRAFGKIRAGKAEAMNDAIPEIIRYEKASAMRVIEEERERNRDKLFSIEREVAWLRIARAQNATTPDAIVPRTNAAFFAETLRLRQDYLNKLFSLVEMIKDNEQMGFAKDILNRSGFYFREFSQQ